MPLTTQHVTVEPHLNRTLLDTHTHLSQSLVGSLLLSPGPWYIHVFFFGAKSLFPQSCGSSVITSHWPSTSNSLGTLSLFSGSPGWESCCRSLNFCNSARNSLVSLFSSLWVICSVALWWGWWRPPPRELMPRSQLPLYWNIYIIYMKYLIDLAGFKSCYLFYVFLICALFTFSSISALCRFWSSF